MNCFSNDFVLIKFIKPRTNASHTCSYGIFVIMFNYTHYLIIQ